MEQVIRPKNKKPNFARQQSKIFKKLKTGKWRAPKGMHSKLRRKRKGKGLLPSIGYSSPRKFKGLSKEGLIQVNVSNSSQLVSLTKKHGVILSRYLGTRKRLALLEKIKAMGLRVINISNIDAYKNKIETERKMKAEIKNKKDEKKKISKEESIKKAQEKEPKEETQEEKEKRQKEEKRKVLEQQR